MSTPSTPPHTITPAVLTRVAEIGVEVGRLGAFSGQGQAPLLRQENRIRSIHATRSIENQLFMPIR